MSGDGGAGGRSPGKGGGITRRDLLQACAAIGTAAGVLRYTGVANARIVELGFPKKTIVGYCWPWTARPGETIEFKVSTYAPGPYTADLVRLICADAITDGGKHYREDAVDAPFAQSYAGRNQPIHCGSFVEIADGRALDRERSFTLVASIYPTTVKGGMQLAGPSFSFGVQDSARMQHVVSRWNEPTRSGWSLAIDEDDRVAFIAGDGSGSVDKIVLATPLHQRRWVRIGVTYDADSRRVAVTASPVFTGPGDRVSRHAERAEGSVTRLVQRGAVRFGAAFGAPGNGAIARPAGAYNGKLDAVRLMRGVLGDTERDALGAMVPTPQQQKLALGWWDFARGTGTIEVHDLSSNGLNGRTVNLPERAVKGVNWDGTQLDWKTAPDHYSAIYFHASALIDAEWKTDFEFRIPPSLRSGIYAARLRHGGSEDYIPFYVAPAKTAPKAKVALVIPTYTYLAYANTAGVTYWTRKVEVQGPKGETRVEEEEWMPIYSEEKATVDMAIEHYGDFGMGVYRFHSDGAPVRHAPMRIPNLSDRPKAFRKHLTADTDIIEWLEHDGIRYDVITDELVHQEGADLLSAYPVLITGSHTEYHTWEMYRAYLAFLDRGGRLMSIGGNGFHNRIALHPQVPGVVECRKQMGGTPAGHDPEHEAFGEFDGLRTGRFKECGSPANVLHGLGTNEPHPLTKGTYYRLLPAAADSRAKFVFEGVSGDIVGNFGKSGGGAAGEECDAADFREGTPAHTLVLARSEHMVWPMVSEDGLTDPKYRLNFNPRAELVFFETPKGGAVFAVGSMGWRGALYHNGFDNNVARVTRNVLARFTNPQPFTYPG